MGLNFGQAARAAAIAWKQTTSVLPDAAKEPADLVRLDGRTMHGPFDFCLPPAETVANLLPEAASAIDRFAALGLAWPGGVGGGPNNQLLDTWVQCANALVPLTGDPERLALFLSQALRVGEVLPIENDWFVTFGWSGQADHLRDHGGATPPRGPAAGATAHAAVRFRSPEGSIEVALLSWFYAESFRDAVAEPPRKLAARVAQLQGVAAPNGPFLRAGVDLGPFLVEPFERLVHLHLLARGMEAAGELDAERVRVVMVAPSENLDLAQSITSAAQRHLGSTVPDVWRAALDPTEADRFVELDSACLVDPALDLTSAEFRARYADLQPKSTDLAPDLASGIGPGADEPDRSPSWDRRRRWG